MLRNLLRTCHHRQVNKIFTANLSSQLNEKWDLLAAVCLERKPVVTPTLNDLEAEFAKYLSQVEFERSLKADHELRHEKDEKQAALLKNADVNDVDLDVAAVQTAQDFEDACSEELGAFKFASRYTEADHKQDETSLQRKLDRHLVLLTQQTIGKKKYFLPPQGGRQDGESLKQTAERILQENCGNGLKVQFYGNAPSGFYKYKYPKTTMNTGNSAIGAKVFIYFAKYVAGQVNNENKCKWLDRRELATTLPTEYYENVSKFLVDENNLKQCTSNQ
ncbi:mitochondrial ribosomal protein L46 [Carabus blaptoides fortunei]